MTTTQKIENTIEKHGLTVAEFANYQSMQPEKRNAIHEATKELYYQENISMSSILRSLPSGVKIGRCKLRRMLWGRDIGQKPYQYGQKELETMRENCKTLTYKEISEMLGRSKQAVKDQMRRMGINKQVVKTNNIGQ